MRRVDCQTFALANNRQIDLPMDTSSYRGALAHLKKERKRGEGRIRKKKRGKKKKKKEKRKKKKKEC